MRHALKFIFAFTAALGVSPLAAETPAGTPAETPAGTPAEASAGTPADSPAAVTSPAGPFAAAEIALGAQQYQSRPLVVFAESADNPQFQRQLHLLQSGLGDLAERDVVVILDTDPASPSEWRRRLRPSGFSVVQLDKDLTPVFRKPSPWDVREITRAIDRLPSRRQEMLERFPGR
ncbi:DUF4174 domain-containing protein [Falsigemmobacter faecalis]|uniref:DUF4174 domain-containing protein n=1 Tax=Falsigemmobacter faecalis TaxID=2488730 RepID=A0A3P3DQ10_9RHOB|nr:DUF4174 domain-containing protein [Falsigemmobacter faecalis]RRH76343.1 DUF4174 domain-containing protein [Falsigemmobacter faecalis]